MDAQADRQQNGERIVLCTEVVAGKPATLAVIDAQGRLVPDAKVGLSDGEQLITDESGRAHFLAPPESGVLIAQLTGTETRAVADIVKESGRAYLRIDSVPALVSRSNQFAIRGGGFAGDADRNRVEAGGQTALVLAASPLELDVLASPRARVGSRALIVDTGGEHASAQLTLVDVNAETVPADVRPGKKAQLSFHVEGTVQPLTLEIRNLAPVVVRFSHGERRIIKTRGGAVNSASLGIKSLRAGEFSYSVALVERPGAPNLAAARDFLAAALKLAPGVAKQKLSRTLRKLQGTAPEIPGAQKEISKLLAASPSGDYAALLNGARRALSGK